MRVRDGHIDLDTPTGPMRTYVYEPHVEGRGREPGPGLVLYSEIFQQTDPIRRLAVQFASQGYVVMVPEVYHASLPLGTVLGYDDAGKEQGNALKQSTPVAGFDADAAVLVRALAEHPRCNGRVGTVGVCLGGHLAFRCALLPEVRAAACFFATDIHTGTLGDGDDSLARVGDIQGELLMIWGRQDPHIPENGRRRIYAALHESDRFFTWHEFNCAHAFMRDEGERYDAEVAQQCFRLAFDLFRRTL
ncbi:MAG: dienelactone hydrolase family protein [Myxococcota bacterium]|nr:dienelactone hydrolase family protein [Myxococcota bacterium]